MSKEKSLPVRVVNTPTPPLSANAPAPAIVRSPRSAPHTEDHRLLTLVIVAIIMLGIVGIWLATVGASLVKPGEANSLFQSIKQSAQDAFHR